MAFGFAGIRAAGLGAETDAAGEGQPGGGAEGRVDAAVEAPQDAEILAGIAVDLDDARFDFDLRLRAIERGDQLGGVGQPIGQVA